MKVGFAGSRRGMTSEQKDVLSVILRSIREDRSVNELHHGDCIGSDKEAFELGKDLGWFTVAHPSILRQLRAYTNSDVIHKPLPTLERNKVIVDSIKLLIATPSRHQELRSGTWSTIRYARTTPCNLWIINPDGRYPNR